MIRWLLCQLITVALSAMRQSLISHLTNINNSDSNNKRDAAII